MRTIEEPRRVWTPLDCALSRAEQAERDLTSLRASAEKLAVSLEELYSHKEHDHDCYCIDCLAWESLQSFRASNPPTTPT